MRILVIGGTHFVGRHLVERAVARGHEVTVFHRGGSEPGQGYPEVEHVHGDRNGGLAALDGRSFDWVVDVCGYVPRVVRDSARLEAAPRYLFVSTESVYAEPLPELVDESSPLGELDDPTVEEVDWRTYGPLKVLCERAVLDVYGDRALIVRPGYVVGPHDTTDRFTWWVRRAVRGGRMPAPADAGYPYQFSHGEDLGAFMVALVEAGATGAFNADNAPVGLGELLATIARVGGVELAPVWIAEDELEALGLLDPDADEAFPMFEAGPVGRVTMDASKAMANGLMHRPVEQTVRETLAWDRARGFPDLGTGLTAEAEADLLARLDAGG
jgi:2'-hydroxyisoflavone reductase